jgi:alkylation response protein AidB-like acyl-CoA dehydrogenase
VSVEHAARRNRGPSDDGGNSRPPLCVGGDINDFAASEDLGAAVKDTVIDFHAAVSMLAHMPAPPVVAIQGAAAGAGLSLVCLALAARSATFSVAYTGIGLSSDGGLSYTMPRLVGMRWFQSLALTNRTIGADEAADIGLITEVVVDDDLDAHVDTTARKLADGPTRAYAAIRRLAPGQLRPFARSPTRTGSHRNLLSGQHLGQSTGDRLSARQAAAHLRRALTGRRRPPAAAHRIRHHHSTSHTAASGPSARPFARNQRGKGDTMSELQTVDGVRARARAWVQTNWEPSLRLGEWWRRLADAGYAAPELPITAGGLGLDPDQVVAVRQVLAEAGCMGPPGGIGMMLAAPTIATHGTPEQIAQYVAPILSGEHAWCQLFSEPNAGSDLASLECRAVRDGDEWIINGQKVWTSGGHLADMGMLLARTDPSAPKRQGISWFAFPMHQPGVDVRPLREMTGEAVFNEVFLDDARVPDAARIGPVNQGWSVAATTLATERSRLGSAKVDLPAETPGMTAGRLDRRVGELLATARRGEDFLAGTHLGTDDVAQLTDLARLLVRLDDPLVRTGLAELHTLVQVNWWSAKRTAARPVNGADNLAKLAMSELFRRFREVGNLIVGADGMLAPSASSNGGTVQTLTIFSPAPAIYGGTDQVQRNIIGERVLGLPREPA